ncbi:S8 family serine peptidase [Proteiniclasticum sp. SCR006]|uniref:S8 family serine peptidase n=1 Tax=Proteiniclasticum aestuarii TaxID=2817862 RepID=A0A939HAJ5_9CLOT|nr:S8 family serine peptidase [Proteiniclasticum aestuarii]MBO1264065.1 S8 family serine peptidase [Proteiniclasticum aestuarii]
MKRLSSRIATLLLFLFLFTSSGFMAKADVVKKLDLPQRNTVSLKDDNLRSVSLSGAASTYKDDDLVRVIVEVTGNPVIAYATERGIKVSEIDKAKKQSLIKENQARQKAVKALIKAAGISMKELNSFTNVLNGFSIETQYRNIKDIENLSGVTHVSIANTFSRPDPDMENSKDIVNAVETWALGYNGEGMVVAIIDTGIDPSHKDMILTDESTAAITEEDLSGLPGTYRTAKVPYGYNYMDNNQEILDLGPEASEHGMHVAGTVGANGDPDNGGIRGVAPEAQLLAMKVFGNNPAMASTFGDVIVKAIDDSVELGADVINMSLGSTAAYVQEDDLEQVAVRNAMENGVISAISAGNSAYFGNGWDLPYDSNPDIGVVGAPGIANESIQVASIENTVISALALEFIYDGDTVFAPYTSSGPKDPKDVFSGEMEYLYAGLGAPDEFVGQDFSGKIALIMRGSYNFTDKITNAYNAGAAGVIVYNHETGGEELINMAYPSGLNLPAVFIGNSYGEMMRELIASGGNMVSFNGNTSSSPNPKAGNMSDFSSWGTTPDLDFKPEITAPGGNIWSTAQNNEYQTMSGTSMAAPHVAGGSALVLQRVDEEFGLLDGERVQMAKNLLLSTAVPHDITINLNMAPPDEEPVIRSYTTYTSPRRQGAGVMDLKAATTTPAVAYDNTSGISKVSLLEMDNINTFTLELKNFSDEELTYIPDGTVQTDLSDSFYNYTESQGVFKPGTIGDDGMGDYPITFDKDSYTVPANGTVDVEVTVNLTGAVEWLNNKPLLAVFENGTFIEGFVTFEESTDTHPALSIPYMGFYGEWDTPPVVDGSIYDDTTFYGYTSLATYDSATDGLNFLGMDLVGNASNDYIAFSPNKDGNQDNAIPVLSFLRNAKDFEANILDADENVVRKLYMENFLRKNYFDGGLNSPYSVNLSWLWDGSVNGKTVPDGEYFYEVKTRIDYDGAEWQSVKFPVKVDTVRPSFDGGAYNEDTKQLTINASDDFSGIYYIGIFTKNRDPYITSDGVFDLLENPVASDSYLVITDFAGNQIVMSLKNVLKDLNKGNSQGKPTQNEPTQNQPASPVKEPKKILDGDTTAPVVMVTYPEFFEIYNSGNITMQGLVTDESALDYLKINGESVEFYWDNHQGGWLFTHTLTLEDGYHSIDVDAGDKAGNSLAFAHKIFVDSEKPVIDVSALPETTDQETITLKALITDNLPSLEIRLNSDMITKIAPDWSYFDTLEPASYDLNEEMPLEPGINTFTIEALDDAGNKTVETVTIERVTP